MSVNTCNDKESADWVDNWLALRASRSNLPYWRAERELQARVLERARPLVEPRAGPWKKATFLNHIAGRRFRANRILIEGRDIAWIIDAPEMVAKAGLRKEEFPIGRRLVSSWCSTVTCPLR
jgi:hypothetical protein